MISAAPSRLLLLVRHGHSSWAEPGQRDHQRPLDERGRCEAVTTGDTIRREGFAVDHVLCSTATRARETLEGIRPSLAESLSVRFSDDLYALGIEAYYARLRAASVAGCVLVVGHNPMMEDLTASLLASGEPAAMRSLKEGFGTGALAVIGFEAGFGDLRPETGRLRAFIRP